ncbi:MAG: hypothetical protein K1X53_10680 [Candidatus Sumerlaeaceae bacterium]|nr:hypothetical protein [Candidatus Sumerlaeaceae bacterium]
MKPAAQSRGRIRRFGWLLLILFAAFTFGGTLHSFLHADEHEACEFAQCLELQLLPAAPAIQIPTIEISFVPYHAAVSNPVLVSRQRPAGRSPPPGTA